MKLQKNTQGFTLLEMMIVLSIIALIFLLTLPNIQQKEKIIRDQGCNALVEVINSQAILYEVENLTPPPNINAMIQKGYLKESQKRCPSGRMIEIVNGQAKAQ